MNTTDPTDPELGHGFDTKPIDQHKKYLVLSDEEIAKGFVRPVRRSYTHQKCGTETVMGEKIAETYAVNPGFYGATYCVNCRMHLPVAEFNWKDGSLVGS